VAENPATSVVISPPDGSRGENFLIGNLSPNARGLNSLSAFSRVRKSSCFSSQ
jgi:hypothetical protein